MKSTTAVEDAVSRAALQAALRDEFYRAPADALLDRKTIGAAIYKANQTMEALAINGNGPKFRLLGRRALYRKGDVLEWIEKTSRTVESTAQHASQVKDAVPA